MYWNVSSVLRKSICAIELLAELAASFVMGNHSHLKEWLPVNGYSDLGYLADVFSQKNKVKLSLQGKQLTKFIANDKLDLLSES